MGIFSTSSPFDEVVGKATLETNTKEDWALILDICDRVGTSSTAPKECLRSIVRRLNHPDPHVVVQAVTLLDACVSNCGLPFHLEIASREFEQEFRKLLTKIQEKSVRDKLLHCIEKWAENEFRSDPQLDLIPSLVSKLKAGGVSFPSDSPNKSKKSGHHHHHHKSKDIPSSSAPVAQEDADLAKAIELSLKEAQTHPQSKSLYPQATGLLSSAGGGNVEEKEPKKVRALYDFEAAEENELTFYAGEIVFVTDDSDTNWWQGSNQRGKGLFPANFVTYDLSVEPTKLDAPSKKSVQFSEDVEVQSIKTEPESVEVDENKIDHLLHILHEADPTGEVEDPPELAVLEEQVNQMGPLIDQELEKVDRRHAQLTGLGGELVEALNMYHNLMREPMGMGPTSMYGGKMGMAPGIPTSAPQYSQAGPSMQYPGYPPYDPNSYSGMRPPVSSPPVNGPMYSSYQPHPSGGMMHQTGPSIPSSMSNGQSGHQQMPPSHTMHSVNPGVPSMSVQNSYLPNMMVPQSTPYMNMPSYDPNSATVSQTGGAPPQMSVPNSVNPQQYGQSPMYPPPSSAPPNAPAV